MRDVRHAAPGVIAEPLVGDAAATGGGPELGYPTAETAGMAEASPEFGVAFLILWTSTGVLTAYLLKRRGHEFRPAAAVGLLLGPLFIPMALRAARRAASIGARQIAAGRPGGGPVDVLIALAGPGEGVRVARPMLDLLGERVGRVTIATAIDYESVESDDWSDAKGPAALELEVAVALLGDRWEPATALVPGRPAAAFDRFADEGVYDLIVLAGPLWPTPDGITTSSGPAVVMAVAREQSGHRGERR